MDAGVAGRGKRDSPRGQKKRDRSKDLPPSKRESLKKVDLLQ